MRRRTFLGLLAGAPLLLAGCAESPAAGGEDTGGYLKARPGKLEGAPEGRTTPTPQRLDLALQRDGFFYVPEQSKNAPVLLFLHGATGSGERAIQRFIDYANRTGTIVIAPDSREHTWGVVLDDDREDTRILDLALDKIFKRYSVDAKRVVIGGFSDGASAALTWGLLNGDLFSGVAAFSPGFLALKAAPVGKPKVFVSHGTEDSILPIERCGRRVARVLKDAGYTVNYQEFEGEHTVPPEIRDLGLAWLMA